MKQNNTPVNANVVRRSFTREEITWFAHPVGATMDPDHFAARRAK